MILNARDVDDGATLQADVCIAGAGAAGITIARELSGRGLAVMLLESGHDDWDADVQDLYKGASVGQGYTDLKTCRVRIFGGTTYHWAGWCRPLDPDDFDARDWLPLSGWPLSRSDLEPWYHRAHDTCEIGAVEYDAQALSQRSGRPPLPLDPTRVETVFYQYSPPTRFGPKYRKQLADAADVEVYLRANVTEVELAAGGAEVAGFRVATLDGGSFRVQATRYVLALGAIENARILLASNKVAPAGVGNGEDLVGRHFMEHPHYFNTAYLVLPADIDLSIYDHHNVLTFDDQITDGRMANVRGALGIPKAIREAEGLPAAAYAMRTPDAEDVQADGTTGTLGPAEIAANLGLRMSDIRVAKLHARVEQRPLADSRVTLGTDTDALGVPRARLDWRIATADVDAVQRGLELIGRELGRAGLGRLWLPLDADGRYTPARTEWGCHHMGTTRMGADVTSGVVDADCKVHGVANLWCAGSSVFSTVGFANPTLTIVALAHRLGDHLGGLAA